MASKDWKIIRKAPDRTIWNNKKLNQDLNVSDMRKNPVPNTSTPFNVLIAEVEKDQSYNQLESEWFKNKSQAMVLARNYMENH